MARAPRIEKRAAPEVSVEPRFEALTQLAADFTLQHGLTSLSLRPLAKALGTSDRMLLYHFKTKDRLIEAVVGCNARRMAEALAHLDNAKTVGSFIEEAWRVLSTPQGRKLAAFFLELHVLASREGQPYQSAARALGKAWQTKTAELLGVFGVAPARRQAMAELLLSSLDGALLLGLVQATNDRSAVPAALKTLVTLIEHALS